jgi:protocatechuate 3,4-dioxygenase beta subunit
MALFLTVASCSFAEIPMKVELVEVKKIWDKAPHNAFTDLVRWHDAFYCAFREGRGHVSTDGRIRILKSKDSDTWTSAALISQEGFDLRDAHLSVTPDGRLMLLGGAAPRNKDNQSAPTGTFVSFSKDGKQWTEPQIAVEPGRWLWCVTWYEGKAYGVSYTAGKGSDRYLDLLVSDDGIRYTPHVPKLFEQGYPTEVTLRFDSEGTFYALVRRDRRGDDPSSATLGISRPDYKQWQWKDLGPEFNGFGGPNFIQIPGEHWLAAGRMHDGGAHTALCYLDVENGKMTRLLKLPSGGDTSYPGMVCHNDMLYVSYYSSHEAKTSIYLAKIRLVPKPNATTGNGFELDELDSRLDEITQYVLSARKISGLVSGITGDPQKGAEIKIVPAQSGLSNSDAEGRFNLEYEPKIDAGPETDYYLSARHETLNLAAFQLIDENTKSIELRLEPAVTLTGTVINTEGRYVAGAEVRVLIRGANWKGSITNATTHTDANGFFRFKAISTELPISNVIVTAKGHCQHFINRVDIQHAKNDIKLKTITLHEANLSVSGVVVDVNDQPVSGAVVKVLGGGEPRTDTITDSDGRFKVEKLGRGGIRIIAKRIGDTPLEGFVDSQAGATDVKVKVTEVYIPPRLPVSKVGKSLSDINNLDIGLNTRTFEDSAILLCFFNFEQRPSRNCMMHLVKKEKQLKGKGVTVIAIHASNVDENTLNEWIKKNNIPFPVGMIQDDEEKIRFNWGVRSLPWLILTDRKHIVTAEGFGLDELDEKIGKTGDGN